MLFNGLSLKSFGSQGQVRTAAISLKLSEREIFRDDTGEEPVLLSGVVPEEEPVLLLDDVLSELDEGRQDFLLHELRSGQVFITCCEEKQFPRLGGITRIVAGQKME